MKTSKFFATVLSTVLAWGGNGYAELGDGTYSDRLTPIPLSGLNGATSISTGFFHSIALIASGTIVAWGNNEYGQLGDGTVQQRLTPAPVSGITGVRAVAVGDLHSVALKTDGTVLTWGDNASGQLGNGARIFRSTPVPLAMTGVTKISAGAMAKCETEISLRSGKSGRGLALSGGATKPERGLSQLAARVSGTTTRTFSIASWNGHALRIGDNPRSGCAGTLPLPG